DVKRFEDVLAEQAALEQRQETNLRAASTPTGTAFGLVARHLAELHEKRVKPDDAATLGDRIGRCSFLVDAYQDYARDVASGSYNPLVVAGKRGNQDLCPEKSSELGHYLRELSRDAQTTCGRIAAAVAQRWRATRVSLEHQFPDDASN